MRALYEVCDDLRLPVLFHMDEQRGMDEPGLPGLEAVLKTFPKVPFIGHGPGFWASISGDRDAPRFRRLSGGAGEAGRGNRSAVREVPQSLGRSLGRLRAGAIGRDRVFGREFLVRNADRLLFGTDYLKPGQYVPQFQLLASFELPAEARAKIERGNAGRLFGIKV